MSAEDRYMGGLYQRFPVTVERASGARLWDAGGKEYIDCMGGYGVALVGHCNPRVVRAVKEQLDRVITVHSSLYNRQREQLLERLIGIAPKGLEQAHLNNSGAEAVEAAIKFARKHTGRRKMVAMRGGYHGKSMGALSLTFSPKYKKSFEPLLSGVDFVPFGDAEALEGAVTEETAMVIMEPVQGEGGIHVAPDGFLRQAKEACAKRGALLAFDEIQSGLGRTGKMWACDHDGVSPDILCMAKGMAGGIPMGATLVRPEILASMSKGDHSSTFGGNPLSCAAASAAIAALTEDKLVQNAEKNGRILLDGLRGLAESHKIVREVRGRGLMAGMELKFEVRDILNDGIKNGVLLLYSGRNVLRFLPPLVISEDEIARVLAALDGLLSREEARRSAG